MLKKIFSPLVLGSIWAMVFCSGCDFIYHLLQKEGAEEKKIIGEVIPNESNPVVVEIQKLLKLYGYKVGKVDGKLGNNTRNAVADFQKDNGITVSRFVDQKTWDKLHELESYGLLRNGEVRIDKLQQALRNAGFNPGKPDGKMGRKTMEAIVQFQKAKELKADGAVGYKTLIELEKYLEKKSAPTK